MCFGKPVLNLYAIDDCPSLPYFEKYPLSINADMQKPLDAKVASEIEKSITEFAGKSISFEEVKEKLITCTPDYVTDSILKQLN